VWIFILRWACVSASQSPFSLNGSAKVTVEGISANSCGKDFLDFGAMWLGLPDYQLVISEKKVEYFLWKKFVFALKAKKSWKSAKKMGFGRNCVRAFGQRWRHCWSPAMVLLGWKKWWLFSCKCLTKPVHGRRLPTAWCLAQLGRPQN